MKASTCLFWCSLFFAAFSINAEPSASNEDLERSITQDQVIALVTTTCAEISKDGAGTFQRINKGEAPFKDAANPTLYAFVYNTEVVMIAHPRADLVGKSVKGKPDVKGKKFRDEIVSRAATEGTGWVDYYYQKPGEPGIHHKTTYFAKLKGSDGVFYVVCAGMYVKAQAAK